MENDPSLPLHLDENGEIVWPNERNIRNYIVNVDLAKQIGLSFGKKISYEKFNKIISAAMINKIPTTQHGEIFYVNEEDYDKWIGGLG